MANRSRQKSDKLRAVEDGARQLEAKKHQIHEKIYQNVDLCNELNTLKQEHTREVWLLKNKIKILIEENKAWKKAHQGNFPFWLFLLC